MISKNNKTQIFFLRFLIVLLPTLGFFYLPFWVGAVTVAVLVAVACEA